MPLIPGNPAPQFSLRNQDGEVVSLSKVKSPFTVVYFYPKDDTPGCTIEAKEFTAALPKLKKAGIEIIGISGGDESAKAKFCAKHSLEVTLLSDRDLAIAKAYGAFGEKQFMGRKFKGVFRMTFILDQNKNVLKIYDKVKPEIHAQEVLSFVLGETSEDANDSGVKDTVAKNTLVKKATVEAKKVAKIKTPKIPKAPKLKVSKGDRTENRKTAA